MTYIFFAGNAGDCLLADYLQGTAPGAQGQQCAVSSALAWALFGSNDIVGQTLTLDRTQYTICGVFDADAQILLYPGRNGFTHAALRGTSPEVAAEQWAAAAGAGEITAIDYGPQRVWLAGVLRLLPAALVGVGLLAVRAAYAILRWPYFSPWRCPISCKLSPVGSSPAAGATLRSGRSCGGR